MWACVRDFNGTQHKQLVYSGSRVSEGTPPCFLWMREPHHVFSGFELFRDWLVQIRDERPGHEPSPHKITLGHSRTIY